MLKAIKTFLQTQIIQQATRRPETVKATAWGKERTFCCFDLYDDTFIFEEGIWEDVQNKDPVVLLPKMVLGTAEEINRRRVAGNIMMISTGNHAITSLPLLTGEFWDFQPPDEDVRGDVMRHQLVCANCVGDTFEISQREVPTAAIVEMDEWLQGLGLSMSKIVILDRVNETLEHYRRRGQEWRVKPLAWTLDEMENALRASLSRMHSCIRYYHNVKGVHFLSLPHLLDWGAKIEADFPEFLRGLNELAATTPDAPEGNLLLKKYHGHHEIEFFGVMPGIALRQIVPLVRDFHAYAHKTECSPKDARERFDAIAQAFRSALIHPDLGNDSTVAFKETLYRNITGEVYTDEHDSMARAFDDMRKALPGATYAKMLVGKRSLTAGRAPSQATYNLSLARSLHEGVDDRTIAILDAVELDVSAGDRIEYINVYEIRSVTNERVRPGDGKTREVVYKTEWNPLPIRVIEKRLALKSTGYGAYTIARTHAFRSLGIAFGQHRMLARQDGSAGDVHYFMRTRYPGEPFNSLPPSSFFDRDPMTGKYNASSESKDVVRTLIMLIGTAAAENMILKKWKDGCIRFAEGKEIVEFGYNIQYAKQMPLRIWLCSVRGTMGWPDCSMTDENFDATIAFYIPQYAQVVADYAREHPILEPQQIAEAFLDGFSGRTREICWNYTSSRERFDTYDPKIYKDYQFQPKWRFALWSLERQAASLPRICEIFRSKFDNLIGAEELDA
ncbi:MAG: hypothetical protein ACOX9C_10400 [Kiritimatiellia bacterium]|jgi:hypothetical protein